MANHSVRNCKDWLDDYILLQAGTEPARIFDVWTGLYAISAALRRKVFLRLGRLTYNTNIYVVLVADPGVARKTQAIKFGEEFITTVPEIIIGVDSTSKEAMQDDIEKSKFPDLMPDGQEFLHSSLCVISKEFESFLGQKKENNRMLTALTDLYDCPSEWKSRTRHSESNTIIRPWLGLLAATTPDSLASSLPSTAVGGGLTSRIMFIWAEKKKRPAAIPELTQEEIELKSKLTKDYYQISRISGEYKMAEDCQRKWVKWYNNFDEDESGIRVCQDKSFSGWYARKPMLILKISMLCAASESNNMLIEWRHVERAIALILEIEYTMGNAFKSIGKSELSAEVGSVAQIIKTHGSISEKQLMSMVWRDMDATKFDVVIETLRKSGKIGRRFETEGDKGIYYYSTE